MRHAIGLGTRRAGTSSLHRLLGDQPTITKPSGGLHYFSASSKGPFDLDSYRDQFVRTEQATTAVDLSVSYSYPAEAELVAERIAEAFVDEPPILFVVVRDPVDRCVSDFHRSVMLGELPDSIAFAEAIGAEPDLVTRGLYSENLQPFVDRFGADALHVLAYEELQGSPERFFTQLNGLLGCSIPVDATTRIGPARSYRMPAVVAGINKARGIVDKIGLSDAARSRLARVGGAARTRLEQPADTIDAAALAKVRARCHHDAAEFAAAFPHLDLATKWTSTIGPDRDHA